jgi:hypothetical protein
MAQTSTSKMAASFTDCVDHQHAVTLLASIIARA